MHLAICALCNMRTFYVIMCILQHASARQTTWTDHFLIFEALSSSYIQRLTFQFVYCRSFRVLWRPCYAMGAVRCSLAMSYDTTRNLLRRHAPTCKTNHSEVAHARNLTWNSFWSKEIGGYKKYLSKKNRTLLADQLSPKQWSCVSNGPSFDKINLRKSVFIYSI